MNRTAPVPASFPDAASVTRDRADHPTWNFLRGVLRHPVHTGAIAPSTRRLARFLVREARVAEAGRIIELGAGTGVVTNEIFRRKPARAQVMAVEWNAEFCRELVRRHSRLVMVNACASQLAQHAAEHGVSRVDSIVSGLPWTVFDAERQLAVLRGARDLLAPAGVFTTLACWGLHRLPAGRDFENRLRAVFPQVEQSRVVWANLPPMFVYVCRPAASGATAPRDPGA